MTDAIDVRVRRLEHSGDLPLPGYATDGAAGMDVRAAVDRVLKRGEHAAIPTGFAYAVPRGHEIQVRPRSGLAAKHGVTVLNSPGTIDSDYRGEVMVLLINHGGAPFQIERGMRIAQIVFAPVSPARLTESATLDETARGAAGFGSTGTA